MTARALAAAAIAASLAFAGPAMADEPRLDDASAPVDAARADQPTDAPAPSVFAPVVRPWLYTADPTAPPPGHVIATLGVGYASLDRGAARPFAADVAHAGAVTSAGAEVGVLPHLTLSAEGLLAGRGGGQPLAAGAMAGLGVYVTRAESPIDLAVSGGYLRELGGDDGVWMRAAIAGDIGRARLTLSGLGSHVFDPTRDGFDLLVSAGVSYAVVDAVRFGAEYVAQDLEGAWDPTEADGGMRHFVGPNVALDLADHRVKLAAGPAFGLSPRSPRVLGRLAASYAF